MESFEGFSEDLRLVTMSDVQPMNDIQKQQLLAWVDEAPITRDKRNLARDMSDAVPVAEIIKYRLPKFIELHSYQPANSVRVKEQNWFLINRKVLQRLGFELDMDVIHSLAQGRPWVIETVLQILKTHIDRYLFNSPAESTCLPVSDESPEREAAATSLKAVNIEQRRQIQEQKKTIESLTIKVLKLEHLARLKDIRIQDLMTRLGKAGLLTPEEKQTNGRMSPEEQD